MIRRLLDALLGPRCDTCGERVFPRDVVRHWLIEHAGDWPTDDMPRPCGSRCIVPAVCPVNGRCGAR